MEDYEFTVTVQRPFDLTQEEAQKKIAQVLRAHFYGVTVTPYSEGSTNGKPSA